MIETSLQLTSEQWAKAREIYAQALDEPLQRRMEVALGHCGGDVQLESQIRALLSANDRAGSFLLDPAIVALNYIPPARELQELESGTVLNKRFRIERLINTGGMGSVYEAWDSELQEVLALKTIRPEIASEPSIIERFKEEVKRARQITHPCICRVYDLFCHEQPSGERIWFLTMQLLEGKTLSAHLSEFGPFGMKQGLVLIEQMISGLAAAHELGVVHMDFKSANVMLVPRAKTVRAVITDFGLAAIAGADPSKYRGHGTPAYVAPEQWKDGIVGPCGDLYALGVVICEMISGERPTPPRSDSAGHFPARLPRTDRLSARWKRVICRCLEVNPANRFGSVTDVLMALDPSRRRRQFLRIAATVGILLLAFILLATTRPRRTATVTNLRPITPADELSTAPTLSPDGSMIAYAYHKLESDGGGSDIYVRHLHPDAPPDPPVAVTSDTAGNDDPSFSPDGRSVAFVSDRNQGGIYISPIEGGNEKLLVPGGRNPRFSADGRSVLYWVGNDDETFASARLYILNLASRKAIQLASGFADARDGVWNSDGRHILFRGCATSTNSTPSQWDWWVTTVDGQTPRATGAKAKLDAKHLTLKSEFGGWYADKVFFSAAVSQGVHLWELAVSPRDLRATGEPEMTDGDGADAVFSSSISRDGLVALMNLDSVVHIWRIDHGTVQDHAEQHQVTHDPQLDIDPTISGNGRWLIFARGSSPRREIVVRDILSGKEAHKATAAGDKYAPIIDDSGSTFAYESSLNGESSVVLVKPGEHSPTTICTGCRTPTGWFRGNVGLFLSDSWATRVDLYKPDTGKLETVLKKPGAFVTDATWSPANQFILFTVSNDHRSNQVFAARFPAEAERPESHWVPVTSELELARKPRWSGDGRTIFYLSNRDNFWCLWAQHFDPVAGEPIGKPFAVRHYHSLRFSPTSVTPRSFNLSVAGDSIYLNVAEMTSKVSTATLDRPIGLFDIFRF